MVELNEIFVLLIVLAGYIPVMVSFKKSKNLIWFFLAFSALVMGSLATVLEEFFLPQTLNFIEHFLGIMGAGILFFVSSYLSNKNIRNVDGKMNKKLGGSKW